MGNLYIFLDFSTACNNMVSSLSHLHPLIRGSVRVTVTHAPFIMAAAVRSWMSSSLSRRRDPGVKSAGLQTTGVVQWDCGVCVPPSTKLPSPPPQQTQDVEPMLA